MKEKKKAAPPKNPSADGILWKYFPWIIFVLALAVRVIVLWQLSDNYPGFNEPSVDSRWHLLWAREIAAGDWLGSGVFYRAPLYPYFLGTIIAILGENLWIIRIIQALMGSVTAVLVYLLGRRVFGRGIGAGASLIWAFWATAIYYESEFLIPVLIIPLNLWALYYLAGSIKKRRWNPRSALFVGLILGLSAIARPNILIFAAGLVLWIFWRLPHFGPARKRPWISIGALVAGVMLPISVVTVRNAVVGHDFVLIAYQGGVNLYLGNNPESDGLTMILPEVRLTEDIDWTEFVRTTDSIASVESGRALKPSEISSFWVKKTINSVLSRPGAEIVLLLKKLYYFWSGFENGDNTDIYRHAKYSFLLRIGLWHWVIWFPFGIVSAFGLWGMWVTRRQSREVELVNVFVWVYMLSVVGFLVTARHRLPVVPVIILFAMAGMNRAIALLKLKTPPAKKIGNLAVIGLLLIVTNSSLFEAGLSNPIQYYYQQGLIFDRKKDYSRAMEEYQKALAIWPNHFPSRRNLAYDFYLQGDYASAIQNFTWALGAKPDDPETFNNLGLAYRASGDTTSAIAVFKLAIRNNPHLIEPYLNLGDTYRALKDTVLSREAYLLALNIDSTYGPAMNNLGLLYIQEGNREEARDVLERGTRLAPDYPFCWLNLGALYLEMDRPDLAIAPLSTFLKFRPRQLEARFNLALAYVRIGNLEAAKAQLEEILALRPQHERARALMEQIINQGK
jgi:tetratricopeptide (TPR) repeat protein